MNQNQFQFNQLDFTHDELEAMLDRLHKGCLLTSEDYKKLIEEIGLDNISTFSGNYKDLIDSPDIFQIIKDSMLPLDIETKAHVNDLIANMSKEYCLIAEQIVNGLREEIAQTEFELREEENEK